MGLGFRLFIRPLMAMMDSEKAHGRSLLLLRIQSSSFIGRFFLRKLYSPQQLPRTCFDLKFPNPLGLAAGMDKKGEALRGWESLGFGFIEMGGITMLEQQGNPKPRMFRSSSHQGLINRMGFNNPGSEKTQKRLLKSMNRGGLPKVPLLINIGKSKDTTLEDAPADYATTVARLNGFADAFVINVSSPNTPGLRKLQSGDELKKIIEACQVTNERKIPLLVKVSPDLDDQDLATVVKVAQDAGCAGIVAANTTTSRPDETKIMSQEGGLSGKPLTDISTQMIRKIADLTDGNWPIIGVGGIFNAEDAWQKIINGASLIQIYSTLVFNGPSSVKSIVNGLKKRLKDEGLSTLNEAVGLARS
jgi:dihydroorotate dehydrogenase